MEKFFWIDKKRLKTKTYSELLEDLSNKDYIFNEINFDDPYEFFLDIIFSMINGLQILISKEKNPIKDKKSIKVKKRTFSSLEDVFMKIEENKKDFRLSMFTSGTTGKPKKISHSFNTLARNLKKSDRFSDNIWAFAYNPTHFAGIQVFLQGFFNKNSFIYIFDSNKESIPSILLENKVNSISATPTFFRFILPFFKKENRYLKNITLGGERSEEQLINKIHNIFPDAKIRNIYASTEAGTLFKAEGEIFEISENIKEMIFFTEENELVISKDLLGEFGYEDKWFFTGDIVEKIDENHFRFLHRKSDIINIGGYNVSPHNIEKYLRKFDEILDVRVYGKTNKLIGNLLCAEIKIRDKRMKDDIEKDIYVKMNRDFEKYEIPRLISFVDEIKKTDTGKKVR